MQLIEIISVLLMGTVKFLFAVPLAVNFEFSFWQTFIITCIGGIIGVLFFAQFRNAVLNVYYKVFPNKKNKESKKGFKDKLAQSTAKKYGLFGIAFLTPVVFSIPFGTFIALHFFPNKKKTIPVLVASVLGWSFFLTLAWNFNV